MNSVHRAITGSHNRLLKLKLNLSPTPLLQQHHHASSKPRVPKTPPRSKPNASSLLSSNDAVSNKQVTWPKPSEIPWQSKVSNSVSLIGRVKVPVQFQSSSSDGKSWAGTIISQDDEESFEPAASPTSFWIPVIFEGDLAHIAMCHLKEKDYVHVAGRLSVDVPPFKLSEVQANVQVMANSISFVEKSQSKNPVLENSVFPQQSLKEPYSISMQQDTLSKRSNVAFGGEHYLKSLNNAQTSPVHNSKETKHLYSDHKQNINASWRDLLTNPKQWLDNREDKRKGLVKANFPDFKHKVTRDGLWLDRAPVEVLQGLGQLEFFNLPNKDEKVKSYKDEKVKAYKDEKVKAYKDEKVKDGDSWKDLVENPNKWWDNRVDKKNPKGPDFKNKDSGKGLWLGGAPSWALPSLPPLKAKAADVNTKKKWASY